MYFIFQLYADDVLYDDGGFGSPPRDDFSLISLLFLIRCRLIIAFYGMGLLLHGLTLDIRASSLFFLPHFTSLEV